MLTNDELKAIGKRADATNEDAEFIAHARADIPALLAHIKYYEDAINTLMHHSTDFESKFYDTRSILREILATSACQYIPNELINRARHALAGRADFKNNNADGGLE